MRAGLASLIVGAVGVLPMNALAHFQELIPSADIVAEDGARDLRLDLAFTHPMERGPLMDMGLPVRFGVLSGGKAQNLKASLRPGKQDGKTVFSAEFRLDQPGDHIFFVEPAPYWEKAEGKWIIHYTKVVVDFAGGGGWDKPVGLPVEIEPLVRPYGLWTGNLFRGIVRKAGKPVPFAEIEVEWRNDGSLKAPSDPFVTQVIKADASGQFAYAMPRAGWWGFAALVDGDKPVKSPDSKSAKVELGGLIWVRTQDMR
jgi:cobalt/nickel transport protein